MSKSVYLGEAVNWDSSLNRGLVAWCMALPDQQRGNVFRDLCNRHHGTLTNGPVIEGARGRPGGFGNILLDTTNDYVEFSSLANVFGGNAEATVALWWRPDAQGTTDLIVDCGGFDFRLTVTAAGFNRLLLGIRDGVNSGLDPVLETGNDAYTEGAWHHIVATVGNADQRLYVNGVLKQSATATFATFDTAGDNFFRLGSSSSPSAGSYDDLRLYFRRLSASEATTLYQESRRGYPNALNWYSPKYYVEVAGGGGGASVPALDQGMFTGGLANLCGGLG